MSQESKADWPDSLECPLCGRELWNEEDYELEYKPSDLGFCPSCDEAVPMVTP